MTYDLPPLIFTYYLNHRPARRKPWEASSTPDTGAAQYEVFTGSWHEAQQEAARRNMEETRWEPGKVREVERGVRAMREMDDFLNP
jgi:hypothetical protein